MLAEEANVQEGGQMLVWIMSDGVGTSSEIFQNAQMIGPNVLSVSPVYNELKEFKEYWIGQLMPFIQNPTLHDDWVYRKYIEATLQCTFGHHTGIASCTSMTEHDLQLSQFGFGSVSVNAAYILAKAMKKMHFNLCGQETSGVCALMKEKMPRHFYKYVRNTTFTYNSEEFPYVPESLTGKKVGTNSTSNDPAINIQNDPLYFIHNFKCSTASEHTCKFVKVSFNFCLFE